jgi:hypothetical protein
MNFVEYEGSVSDAERNQSERWRWLLIACSCLFEYLVHLLFLNHPSLCEHHRWRPGRFLELGTKGVYLLEEEVTQRQSQPAAHPQEHVDVRNLLSLTPIIDRVSRQREGTSKGREISCRDLLNSMCDDLTDTLPLWQHW